jgi:hypothetical protein
MRFASTYSSLTAKILRSTSRYPVLIIGIAAISVSLANAQGPPNACPPVGADTTCGVVITVIQTGNSPCPPQGCAALNFTGQGPYDTIDDTLVGVVNNSNLPITSLVLASANDIFGFDGDGICGLSPLTGEPYVPGPPACPYGPTGYEGPGTGFSNISPDDTTGTVNFNPPIPASGGTAYYSLENSLAGATACSSIVNNSVPKPAGGGVNIEATFTPQNGYTLAQAAQLCGFVGFDWQQTITNLPNPSPYCEINSAFPYANPTPFCNQTSMSSPPYPIHLTSLSTPFNDPPPNGYTYGFFDSFPFYYPSGTISSDESSGNPTLCIEQNPGGPCLLYDISGAGTVLNFHDAPKDPCFIGGALANTAACGFKTAPAGAHLAFTTHVAGINSDGTSTDLGIGFSWTDTFNGGSAGGITTGTIGVGDPTGGTGGITITNVNEITSYQYPKSFGVTAINGNPVTPPTTTLALLSGDQIRASYKLESRGDETAEGEITIKNISHNTITGPFQIVLTELTARVILTNASGSFGGWSYITVPNVGSLEPGQSATVDVEFGQAPKPMDESPECIDGQIDFTFTSVVYSGSFN